GAVEVNLISEARNKGTKWFVNTIVPHTHSDLYSYSSWDFSNDPEKLKANLDYLKAQAPASAIFGKEHVMLGEYGAPQLREDVRTADRQREITRKVTRAAVEWGARYVVYWQVFDNELKDDGKYTGFWIRDNNGKRTPVWNLFRDMFTTNKFPAS
ncbi:MAG: hypothetical protein H0T78_04340, partial [Longispora sp.]|nr:hypothetical protein [Longispora sp. (in: high G+C Gram-positive bacteria)]